MNRKQRKKRLADLHQHQRDQALERKVLMVRGSMLGMTYFPTYLINLRYQVALWERNEIVNERGLQFSPSGGLVSIERVRFVQSPLLTKD